MNIKYPQYVIFIFKEEVWSFVYFSMISSLFLNNSNLIYRSFAFLICLFPFLPKLLPTFLVENSGKKDQNKTKLYILIKNSAFTKTNKDH